MKAAIFTEGGGKKGYGHVTRCLALYHAFRGKGADAEIILDGDAAAAGLLSGARHRLLNWRRKGPETLAALRGAGIAVVDSYLATLSFYAFAAKNARVLVCLDDTNRLPYPPGLVVNGAIAAASLHYPKSSGLRYLLGAEYAPLRKEFWNCPRPAARKNIGRVLITLGGADSSGLAEKIAGFIKNEFNCRVTVFGGRRRSAAEVKREMLRSDVCITACGQTTYELAACGLPSIGVGFAENQRLNIKGWTVKRAMKFAGWKDDKNLFENIKKLLGGLSSRERVALGKRARDIVDGGGALRVAEAALEAYKAPPAFTLRKAAARDSRNIFRLSNMPEVRANSISTDRIEWATHRRWFAAKIKQPGFFFLVAEIGGVFAGQLRYAVTEGEALVSVSISDLFRGRGLAAPLLTAGNKKLFSAFRSVRRINAFIRPDNKASVKAFERSGYRFERRVSMNKVRLGKYAAKR